MRKKLLYILTLLIFIGGVPANARSSKVNPADKTKKHRVSVGLKGGFNSTMTFTDELSYGNQDISGIQNNYKVGYFATAFARITLKGKHFIQPEVTYNISQGSISISGQEENTVLLKNDALIKTKITTLDVPLLYGYKFIDSYPYGMSFFFGPKAAWTIKRFSKSEFSGFYQQDIHEEFKPINYSVIVGLGVNISNVFFDFRYEAGLNNVTKALTYNKQATEDLYNEYDLTLKRRKNILSFSVGVIF